MKRLLCIFLFLSSAFAQNSARMLSGVNVVTTSTYTFVPQDATRLVSFNSASAVAATMPPGSTPNFGRGTMFSISNLGAGSTTITCTCTFYINVAVGVSAFSLSQGSGVDLYSDGLNYWGINGGGGGGGGGTVSSVGLTQTGALFTITGSPITTGGNLNLAFASGAQNLFLATPNGSSGAPVLRSIVAADIPTLNQNTTGTSSTAGNITGLCLPANGCTGVASPTAHATCIAEGASGFNCPTSGVAGKVWTSNGPSADPTWQNGGGSGASAGAMNAVNYSLDGIGGFAGTNVPSLNGAYTFVQIVAGGVAGIPTAALPGVPVDATNPATFPCDLDRASYLNWTSGTALALPAVAGNCASSLPFILRNTSTTLTITPNAGASDLIDGAATGTVLPNFAAFVYQDSTTAPGHWFTVKVPTFAAYGSNCSFGNTWSTTTGIGCLSAAPRLTTTPIALATDVSGQLPIGNVGSAGMSGTSPIIVASTGAISCPTCITSAGASPNLYTEATSAGVTTNSASSTPVNMFTGYTLPASKLTAGHRIVAKACFKHSTGATATTYNWTVGGVTAVGILSGSGAVTPVCSEFTVTAIDNTHQQAIATISFASGVSPTQAAETYTLSNTNAINVTQTAAGTTDVYTAYSLTVDLF